jgi:putative AlgH/UPF0301 family transcriptional regulator
MFIHAHCLDKWQETALVSNLPDRATICSVCKARYRYPSWLYMMYRRTVHIVNFHISVARALCSFLWLSFVVVPLKIFIHAILVLITLPFGSFSLNGKSLTWIGYDFPPQLAVIHDSNGRSVPGLQAGVLLVASEAVPTSSIFSKAVILIIEHSVEFGSKGVVLNCLSRNLKLNDHVVGVGGPLEQEICTVVHTSKLCSRYSYVLNEAEEIYVAECENAYPTLKQLTHVRNRLRTAAAALTTSASVPIENGPGSAALHPGNVRPRELGLPEVRVLRGTCAWTAYQLEGEILAGQWNVVPGSQACVFHLPPAETDSGAAPVVEGNVGHRLYGNLRTRGSTQVCDTAHWDKLRAEALEHAAKVHN